MNNYLANVDWNSYLFQPICSVFLVYTDEGDSLCCWDVCSVLQYFQSGWKSGCSLLDPSALATWLIKESSDIISPIIAAICSASFDCGNSDSRWPPTLSAYPPSAGVIKRNTRIKIKSVDFHSEKLSENFRSSKSPITLVSWDPCDDTKFHGEPFRGGVKCTGVGKLAIFDGYRRLSRKRCDRPMVTMKR